RGLGVALFCLSLGLYTTHVLPWLFFGVAALFLLFCQGLNLRRMAAASLLMLPSVALGMLGFHLAADGSTHVKQGKLEFKATYEGLLEVMQHAPERVLAGWPGDKIWYIVLALGLVWLALILSPRPDPAPAGR